MTREQLSLRIGAVCVIIGSVAVVAFRTAHGDLPTGTGEDTLVYVASHPIYPLVHLDDWLGVLIWAGGLFVLSGSLTHRAAWAIGRLGAANVLVGAAVHIVDFSIDGYALPALADTWAVASPSERPALELGTLQTVRSRISAAEAVASRRVEPFEMSRERTPNGTFACSEACSGVLGERAVCPAR